MSISLAGTVAVVTGSGRGLGRTHAVELARRGAAVVVNDVDRVLADEVVTLIRDAGGRAVAVVASVVDDGSAQAISSAATEAFGGLDIFVHNAGVLRTGYFDQLTDDQIDIVLQTHLRAAFTLTRPAWHIMKLKGYGRIIFTSSGSGLFSHQGLSNYAAAKAGLYGLTKALAFEGEPFGIGVNAILPYAPDLTATRSPAKDPIPGMAEFQAQFGATNPTDPARSDPQLVAQLVSYLASRQCQESGEAYSACYGRYARVFVGVAHGWLAPSTDDATAENIAEHIAEIRDLSTYTVPRWLFDELRGVQEQLISAEPVETHPIYD